MKFFRKSFFIILLGLLAFHIESARKSTRVFKNNKKTYSLKKPYSGLGKPSKVNGRIKAKPVSGYFKPSNGYKFVNPYAKSK